MLPPLLRALRACLKTVAAEVRRRTIWANFTPAIRLLTSAATSRLLERLHFAPELVASIRFHQAPLNIRDEKLRRLAAILNLGIDLAQSLDQEQTLYEPIGAPVALSILNLSAKDLSLYQERMVENMQFVQAMCRSN
jgi:hypothetical protein